MLAAIGGVLAAGEVGKMVKWLLPGVVSPDENPSSKVSATVRKREGRKKGNGAAVVVLQFPATVAGALFNRMGGKEERNGVEVGWFPWEESWELSWEGGWD